MTERFTLTPDGLRWLDEQTGRIIPRMAGGEDPPAGDPPQNDPSANPPANDPPADKTFSQAEVDRIVGERVGRERQKYADYNELKQAKERLDEIEQANATEAEKAAKRADQAEEKLARRTENTRRATLVAALAASEDIGPGRAGAAAKLIEGVEFDDDTDEPTNLDDRVEALLKQHAFLKADAGGQGGLPGNPARDRRGQEEPVTPGLGRLRAAYK